MVKKSTKVGLGLGIAAATAAAALGAYFLYGKDGAKNRKKVRGWALKAKGEVLERLEKLEHVSEKVYRQSVDEVLKKYRGLKNVDAKELQHLANELKKHWKAISKSKAKPKRSRR